MYDKIHYKLKKKRRSYRLSLLLSFLSSKSSPSASLMSIFLSTVRSKQSRLFLSCSTKFYSPHNFKATSIFLGIGNSSTPTSVLVSHVICYSTLPQTWWRVTMNFIILKSEDQNQFHWAKYQGVSRDVPSKGSRRESVSLPLLTCRKLPGSLFLVKVHRSKLSSSLPTSFCPHLLTSLL